MQTQSLDELKAIAKRIFLKAVSAVEPSKRLEAMAWVEGNSLFVKPNEHSERSFGLDNYDRILLIGAGKASASMAQAIEKILGSRITRGIIITKYGHTLPLKYTEVIEAGHPIPDHHGLAGTRKIQTLLRETGSKTLIVFLLSGGASALLPLPADAITLEEKQEVTQLLLDCGADIKEINTVRKHISHVKGGWLARWAYPSTMLSFILSDVVGDGLDTIGSGPTVPDPSTFEDAWRIMEKYGLLREIASSIRERLQLGKEGKLEETPKSSDQAFEKVHNMIIGSNFLALKAAAKEASSLGFQPLILSSAIVGETREAARFHMAVTKEVVSSGNPLAKPACIISGGETTVTLKGHGLGGRNQEFALAAALEIEELEKIVCLSGGTDGTDGPTDAAGALCDPTTVKRGRDVGFDARSHLENNNAYPFFKKLGDLLITGPTYTNVMDVRIILVG